MGASGPGARASHESHLLSLTSEGKGNSHWLRIGGGLSSVQESRMSSVLGRTVSVAVDKNLFQAALSIKTGGRTGSRSWEVREPQAQLGAEGGPRTQGPAVLCLCVLLRLLGLCSAWCQAR